MDVIKKILFCGFIGVLLCPTPEFGARRSALQQRMTLNRFVSDPAKALEKWFSGLGCRLRPAHSSLQTYASGTDPTDCNCTPPFTTSANAWNDCLSCFFMSLVGLYNSFATTFSLLIDPDLNINSTITLNEGTLSVVSQKSALTDYERQTVLSDEDGNVCLSLFYSKYSSDSTRAKGIFHLNTAACPETSRATAYAMAMKFDIGYTTATRQTGSIMSAINPDGAYDLSAGTDSLFYTLLDIDAASGTPYTTAHIYQLVANAAWKFFMRGEDDVLISVGSAIPIAFADTTVDGSDLTVQCIDDTDNSVLTTECDTAGFDLVDYPFTVTSVSTSIFPTWTTDSLSVGTSTAVQDYFAAP